MTDLNQFPCWPIAGPTESVMRFLRGEQVWPEDIDTDTTRSDVWAVNKDQFDRWHILTGEKNPTL